MVDNLRVSHEQRLAERVGFVPANPAPLNNLRLFSSSQNTRNAQNLNIRYKTGTANHAVRLRSTRAKIWPLSLPDIPYVLGPLRLRARD
jgi:hypothetical protein